MFARTGRIAFALSMALPVLASAQGFEYSPSTGQYRIRLTSKGAQEAMGQKQEFEQSSSQLVTMTLARPSKDTITLSAVVDSVSQIGPMGPVPGVEKLIGLKAEAKFSPAGALYSASTRDSSIMGASGVAESLGRFLPKIRGRLVKGASWADTTTGKLKQGDLSIDRTTISKYAVVGDTVIGGERSWKLMRDDSTALSGSGMTQGQALTMEGTSIGKGAMFVSQKGTFVRADGSEQQNVKLVLSANGLEINVVTTTNTTVEKVK